MLRASRRAFFTAFSRNPGWQKRYYQRGLCPSSSTPSTSTAFLPLHDRNLPISLPGTSRSPLLYTFPTLNVQPKLAPTIHPLHQLIEKLAPPAVERQRIEAPPPSEQKNKGKMELVRMLQIKRHKMRKHKRLKRWKRDHYKYQAYHREKKAKAERAHRERMANILNELKTFDPEAYVKDVILRAKREWHHELTPSGRKIHPHWSTLMSIEELYGLEEDDHIDKRSGLPSPEDEEKIRQLKADFAMRFRLTDNDGGKKETT